MLIAFLLFGVWGCGHVVVPTAYDITKSASTPKIPVRAALYLTVQFKTAHFLGNRNGRDLSIAIGDAMTSGAERSMREIFEDVETVESVSSDLAAQSVTVIVTPEIVDLDNRLTGFPPASKWDSRIGCKWTITRIDGKVLYMNTVVGEGQYKAFTTAFTFNNRLGKSMIPAVQDHYSKLVAHLLSVKWWDEIQ